jgi:6-pyruvoyltetrahydropterin/6-carboxytetrahydropterin synthase
MPERYVLKILTDFASAHTLRDYPGDCNRMHGHNWKVEAEVTATRLDDIGMGIDFRDIKEATRGIAKRLDHRYLNDLEPFRDANPTAENIARYFFQELSKQINREHVTVNAVTLWETERASVRYSAD